MTHTVFRTSLIISSLLVTSLFIVRFSDAQEKSPSQTPPTAAAPWLGILLDKKISFSSNGIAVSRVMRQSPAEKAGIQSGDRILKLNDHPIQSADNLQKQVRKQSVGSTVKLHTMRGTKPMEFQVTLTPAPTESQMLNTQLLHQPAPSVTLDLLSPQAHKLQLNTLKGRPTIVEFWATWCQPCIAVAAELAGLKSKHGENIHILAVSSEDATVLTNYIKKSGPPPYMLARDIEQNSHDSFFVSNYPIVFLLNAEHRIEGIYNGRSQLSQLEAKLNDLLENQSENKKNAP